MNSIEFLFEQLEEQGLVFKSANNLLHISIDASDYLDIKRLAKEMHKQEIVKAFDEGQEYEYQYHINNAPKFDSETYYQETFVSKGSDEVELPQQDVDKLGNEDVPKLGYDVEKFAFEWIDKNSHKWSNNTDEVGDNYGSFKAGWNKCKETLYTEEQVEEKLRKAIRKAQIRDEHGIFEYPNEDKIIQSLKQPKKD